MAPPVYTDLGKLARDLFKRGYHPGIWQLDCKSMSSSGIEFFTTGFATQDNSKVMGTLQSKFKIEEHGLTLTERWNTENWLYGEIMQKDKLAEGLVLALAGRFQPRSNAKEGKFKLGYAQEQFNFWSDIDISSSPILNCSLVLGHKEFLGGVGCEFDVGNTKVENWKVALGWTNGEQATVHGELMNGDSWLASLFYKINEKFDAGVEISKISRTGGGPEGVAGQAENEVPAQQVPQDESGGNLMFGVGMIYHLDADSLIRAKINNAIEVGLGYEQKLREGVTASISAVLDGNDIGGGNHKFGVGVALEC
ncbi:voltage-dependent anion-selective channel [Drosophila tropicalis]|uniref:voltage-dependent anion-selective channel n=1 Tax=Drosophila tropicalis TaxID=46794 RepID=UPI0035AC1913